MSLLISEKSDFFKKNEIRVSSKFPDLASRIQLKAKHVDIAALLVDSVLHPLRVRFGACSIDSWLRSEELNRQVGGSKDSDHLHGNAVDPRFSKNIDPLAVFKYIYENKMQTRQCIIYMYKKPIQLHVSINIPGREYKNDFLLSYEPGKYDFYG
jgi:hypothetical protein